MSSETVASRSGLELPFSWWDGLVALALFVVAGVPGSLLGSPNELTQLLTAALLAGYLFARRRLDRQSVFGVSFEWPSVLVGAAMGLLLVFVTGITMYAIRLATGYDHPVYPDWVVFRSVMEVPLLALLGSILFAPLVEEVLFRSMLYRGLLRSMALLLAAVVSALTFAAAHYLEDGGVVRAVGAAVMSVAAIWLFHRSHSLWPAIALHATFNGAVIAIGYVSAQIVGWGTTLT